MKHIVILLHKHDTFDNPPYFLNEIAKIWHEKGLRVSVLHGPEPHPDADLAILHVDLTVVPDDYLAFVRQYPVVINGSVADISKRHISANLVCYDDDYQGQVVVKTNLNCGGNPEAQLVRKGSLLRRCTHVLHKNMPLPFRSRISSAEYRVYQSAGQVPRAVWRNPDLVVERFLPEMCDGYYCLRSWIFLGDKEINIVGYSQNPIVKAGNMVRRENGTEVPDELRQIRKKLGFDYGKFDFAIVDGHPVLYDANRTPALGINSKEAYQERIRLLAAGIRAYF
jgi:hypothetical protein